MARESGESADKDKAVDALTLAAGHYETYVERVTANHVNRIWFNRVGILDFRKQIACTLHDIEIAKNLEVE